jgi:hypothetical protein
MGLNRGQVLPDERIVDEDAEHRPGVARVLQLQNYATDHGPTPE